MNSLFANLEMVESKTMQDQIRRDVRDLTISGQLPVGERLPSTHKLAKLWDTFPRTVHLALEPLVREGLLTRVNRVGTFVRQREERLTKVGLYEVGDLETDGGSPFQRAMLTELRKQLLAEGIEPDVWMDPRPAPEKQQPWDALTHAAQQRRIQAVIMPVTAWAHYNWVSQLPIPSAFFASAHRPNIIHSDILRMAELSVNALADQGCRSIGLITGHSRTEQDEPGFVHEYVEYHQRLREVATARGLRMDEAWICALHAGVGSGCLSQERFGYEQFQALWDLPEQPEGLIVDVDTISQGVVKAVLERQVRVPKELKLVLGKNAHVDLFCPLPVTYCVTDETALARALIEQVQKQFRGESCEGIYIAPTLSR